jgi:hypothetical protein
VVISRSHARTVFVDQSLQLAAVADELFEQTGSNWLLRLRFLDGFDRVADAAEPVVNGSVPSPDEGMDAFRDIARRYGAYGEGKHEAAVNC